MVNKAEDIQCVLLEFPNENGTPVSVGYTEWLVDTNYQNKDGLEDAIQSKVEVVIKWPKDNVVLPPKKMEKKLEKEPKLVSEKCKYVARILAYGEWTTMCENRISLEKKGSITSNKRDRKLFTKRSTSVESDDSWDYNIPKKRSKQQQKKKIGNDHTKMAMKMLHEQRETFYQKVYSSNDDISDSDDKKKKRSSQRCYDEDENKYKKLKRDYYELKLKYEKLKNENETMKREYEFLSYVEKMQEGLADLNDKLNDAIYKTKQIHSEETTYFLTGERAYSAPAARVKRGSSTNSFQAYTENIQTSPLNSPQVTPPRTYTRRATSSPYDDIPLYKPDLKLFKHCDFNGSASRLVGDIMKIIFTTDELKTRSLTGTVLKPALDAEKVNFIIDYVGKKKNENAAAIRRAICMKLNNSQKKVGGGNNINN